MTLTRDLLQRGPDTARGPDLSFVGIARLPPSQIPEEFIPGAPDLAVEILSPGSRWAQVEEKLADYFAAGARLVWVVDPAARRVITRHPDRRARVVAAGDTLDGNGVLTGFAVPVEDCSPRLPRRLSMLAPTRPDR